MWNMGSRRGGASLVAPGTLESAVMAGLFLLAGVAASEEEMPVMSVTAIKVDGPGIHCWDVRLNCY